MFAYNIFGSSKAILRMIIKKWLIFSRNYKEREKERKASCGKKNLGSAAFWGKW